MTSPTDLDALNPDQLRALARQLMIQVDEKTRESHYRQTRIDQLNHEQLSLLDEAIDEDLAALEAELDELAPGHRPRSPASETLIQEPEPLHVIDKGIPTCGLLAQVLVAKYGDHLPLYRQERIFARAGLAIPQSTLGGWVGICGVRLQPLVDALREEPLQQGVLHADETPVQMLSPGKGRMHRAYLWAYTSTQFADVHGVVYEFAEGRSGEHARAFLGNWRGKLVVDDFSGYKAGFKLGITEIGCMAHARRKFFAALYDVEREAAELGPEQRQSIREERGRPIAQVLHVWMLAQRKLVSEGSAIAKALDHNLKRWQALMRYLDDPDVPIDNNRIENLIRPWAIGRANWLFAGALRAGQRAAAIMSLVRSAQLNGHDPYVYLKDVLTRLPTHRNSDLAELLPHRWKPDSS